MPQTAFLPDTVQWSHRSGTPSQRRPWSSNLPALAPVHATAGLGSQRAASLLLLPMLMLPQMRLPCLAERMPACGKVSNQGQLLHHLGSSVDWTPPPFRRPPHFLRQLRLPVVLVGQPVPPLTLLLAKARGGGARSSLAQQMRQGTMRVIVSRGGRSVPALATSTFECDDVISTTHVSRKRETQATAPRDR